MKKFTLKDEEMELLDSLESNEWKSVENLKEEMASHQIIARNTLKKDKRVNLRMSSRDLEDIKAYAIEEGLPYQTLMSSVLHKFISGRLVNSKG